jgi:hypothetical protein
MARPQMHRQAADRFAICEGSQYRSDFGCPRWRFQKKTKWRPAFGSQIRLRGLMR